MQELVECLAADSTASIDTADANKHAFLAAARDLLPHRFRARRVLKQQQQLTQYTLEQICLACATAVFRSAWLVCSDLSGLCVQICLACVFRSAWLVQQWCSGLPGLCVQICLDCVFRSAWLVCSDLPGLCKW